MFRQGYRPATIDDLHLTVEAMPEGMDSTFCAFHAVGRRRSETSEFATREMVIDYFNERRASEIEMQKLLQEELKREGRREKEEREERGE